ncbi:SKP1-like protein 11 [Nicotiana tabacum]|uniref:SKP1-like protein 11 n=1 Tax=Nicotiana tabacum TaxID=4097 RepID=A0A1S3XNZ4_TOBAC|nr:PREDICTED: SKP1-like protein 11 [Nicotiana tabacum]
MSSEKLLTLKTSDGAEFQIEEAVAVRSQLIKNMAEAEGAIHLPNVRSDTMIKVIEYWKKHSEKGISEDELNNFDKNLVKLHHSDLFELVVAANFLADR